MTDNYNGDENRIKAAKAMDAKERRSEEILQDTSQSGINLKDEILSYYFKHFTPSDDNPGEILSLKQIAKLTIPNDYEISAKLAGEIISSIVYQMYREYLINEKSMYDEEQIKSSYHLMNSKRTKIAHAIATKNKPERSINVHTSSLRAYNEKIGAKNYPESFREDFFEIISANLHPEDSKHAGNVNWKVVLEILNKKYPEYDNFTNTDVLRRLRSQFERNIKRRSRFSLDEES